MLYNKKYNIVKTESIYEKTNESDVSIEGSTPGRYKSLCISPIPYRAVNSLKISATDSQISPSYIATLPISTGIGRITYRPLYFNTKIKRNHNPNVCSKAIHVIPQDLFELLPESKVDPDVVSNTRKVCQTYCLDEAVLLPDSHAVNHELNNRLATSGQEVSPCLQSKPRFDKKVFSSGDSERSSVFTLVGRQIANTDRNILKTEINETSPKTPNKHQSEGTLFSVLASPKARNQEEVSVLKDCNSTIKRNDEREKLNKKLDSIDLKATVENYNTNNDSLSISDNDSHYKDVKVSVNEKLNFRLSVPQELPIQSIKEFCRVMIQDKEVNQTAKPNKESKTVSNDICFSEITEKYDRTKHLPTLKSPAIVKEVMKKIASIPSGGFQQNVDINLEVTESTNVRNSTCHSNNGFHKLSTASDAEAMLVIQELDRSIAEGSPSNANSPVITPRIYDNIRIHNNSTIQSIKLSGLRPNKPPRLLSSSSTINVKRQMMIERTETQTDNLIEEVYLTKPSNKIQVNQSNTAEAVSPQNTISLSTQKTTKDLEFQNSCNNDNDILNYKNNNSLSFNCGLNREISATNDLECAIARASLSSIDSGTSSPHPTHATHFIVVAIDFGTTFSGYSFSFTRDPDNIHVMRKVEGCDPDVSNQKIPTVLLLNPDGAFHSFGFAARDHYSNLEPKDAKRWFYFEKFKMNLHYDESLSLETTIKETNGNKSMAAITVFAHALRYFKLLALQELSDQSAINILNDDIRWVITVPAIWKPSAKQFMRAAAYEAGIGSPDNPYQLLIALEPEAASIYCRRLKMNQLVPSCPPPRHSLFPEKRNPNDDEMAVDCVRDMLSLRALNCSHSDALENEFSKGTKYIVVDVGGGTVDITCHQIQAKQGSLKELHKAMGGPQGSILVDHNFQNLLSDIFGVDFIKLFKTKRPSGYVDLMAAFEARKRSASSLQCTTSNISLPFSFINFFKKTKGCTVENAVKKYSRNKGITYCSKLGMLRLDPSVMQQLFESVTKQIIDHISDVLNNKLVKDVSYLFLVGGFAESQILQSNIRKAFSSRLKVIIPQSPNLAILRGATIYGLDPTIISCRRARLTYGVGVLNKFIRGKHPLHKLAIKDNIEWCADVFDKFVYCDQSLGLFETITRSYTPVYESQTCSIIHIYCSERDNIEFITDEGVQRCGTLYLDLDVIKSSNNINPAFKLLMKREIQTQMMFGDTEIKVTALDVSTGKCVKAEIDFLNN